MLAAAYAHDLCIPRFCRKQPHQRDDQPRGPGALSGVCLPQQPSCYVYEVNTGLWQFCCGKQRIVGQSVSAIEDRNKQLLRYCRKLGVAASRHRQAARRNMIEPSASVAQWQVLSWWNVQVYPICSLRMGYPGIGFPKIRDLS